MSLDYLTVDGATPVEQVLAAAEAGFDAVGLRLLAPPDLPLAHEVVDDPATIRAIGQACRRTGVAVLDAEAFFIAPALDPERLVRATAVAAELGASTLLAVIADADRPRALDRFAGLCDAAGSLGLDVALEFMRWSPVGTVEDAAAFVDATGCANAGVCIDALHLSRSGGWPGRLPAVPRAGTFIQLSDAPAQLPAVDALLAEARGDRRYPGDGDLPLDDLLDALPADTPVSIEVPHRVHARLGVTERARLAGDALRAWLTGHAVRTDGRATREDLVG